MIILSLDLHGKTHKEAEEEVEASLLSASSVGSFDMTIITGNSDAMKNKVIKVCEKYNFKYAYPVINPGVMIVTHFKL
jgi:hypothetical protein